MKVKLPNGNVANRVLPVRIHDLDADDIKLCESVLGGVLRGVEFIYKEPGVNRSLTPKDDEKKNLNKTKYRNQINKVALAIKEIIQGLRVETGSMNPAVKSKENFEEEYFNAKKEKSKKNKKTSPLKLILFIVIILGFIIAGIIFIPKLFKQESYADGNSSDKRICVAVFPFNNLTNDSIWNNYQTIVQQNLISTLAYSPDIRVRQQGTIRQLVCLPVVTMKIMEYPHQLPGICRERLKLIFSFSERFKRAGSGISIDAQVTETKSGEVIKPFKVFG